jgi:hypothetical protein
VLEPGVGTGHNLEFYHPSVHVTGVDVSICDAAAGTSKARACALRYNRRP